jgi:hypothetical protein
VIPHGVAVFAFAVLASAQPAPPRTTIAITPDSIAGIHLGMTQAKAMALLGKPMRLDQLEEGFQRFVSGRQKLEVYFKKGTPGVVTVTTWNRALTTDKQIGPCSSVAALKRAYGAKLKPFWKDGRIVAYRLGNLIFTTEDGRSVAVVGLGRTVPAVYVALNAPECRQAAKGRGPPRHG